MKINFKLPDWADNKLDLFMFRGFELVAVNRFGTDRWVVKTGRCNRCGECCKKQHIDGFGLPLKDGACEYLRFGEDNKTSCGLGRIRPWACCIGEPKFEPKCTCRWEASEDD